MPSSSDRGPRAGVVASWMEGWKRTLGAPAITIGVMLATLVAAVPLAVIVGSRIEADLGSSAEADAAADGWHAGWAAEFAGRSEGVARTFTHEIIGFGGTLSTLSRFVDAGELDLAIATAVAGYLLLWLFLWGGILDRYARQRPIRAAAFFAACGVHFLRFLRLAALVAPLYWALFALLHPLLFETAYDWWTRDLTSEREAALARAALYAVFLGALAAVGLVADVARVRAVVEDRHSMIGALAASIRFVGRRPVRLAGLYALNIAALGVILSIWAMAAPGAGASSALGLLAAELYLLARMLARLALAASEVAFFQGELAHATYAAAPLPVWPDSPTVEALDNLANR